MALEDMEHQLGRAKARVYDLDTDLRAARYAVRKAEDALEQQAERQEFIQSEELALKVPTQLVKREADELSIPWDALRDYTKLETKLEQRREAANNSFKGIIPHLIGSEFTWEVGSAIRSWTSEGAF